VILVETNILVAVANGRDNNHRVAADLLETVPEELLVTPTVIADVCYVLQGRAGALQKRDSSGLPTLASLSWPI
jgi:predicted nucleic acid-binding protein